MENKYCVFGGLFEDDWYGDTQTLEEAKRLASEKVSYIIGEGLQRPSIYRIEDTVLEEITEGIKLRVIKPLANPIDW